MSLDPYKPTLTISPDPVSGLVPTVTPRDPFSAEWKITGASGLSASSTLSADEAILQWNRLVNTITNKTA
ncbi:hypothetical protein ACNBFH_004444 [Salmonella enterica subsp. enterica serovar Bareilly]